VSVNRFFVPQIRIQSERGHGVVSSGPYSFVRHPGYAGTLVAMPASALALGSWWALVPAVAGSLLFVRRTADDAIVCLHDANVERTTDGSGRVESFRLEELQRLDAGYRWSADGGQSFPFRGRGIRVPALGEVLARFPGARMLIEMKDGDPAFAQSLCALIRGSGMAEKALVASFHADSLAAFRADCPEVATSMSGSEARIFVGLSRVGLAAAYGPAVPALQVPDRLGENVIATEALASDARRRGLKLHVWTVNDENRMRQLVQIGVEGILTDRPDVLLRLLGRARR